VERKCKQVLAATHTRLTVLCLGLIRASWYQKGKTNLDFTVATDSEWQWHQLGHMQVCTSLQTDNHASNTPVFTGHRPPNQQCQSNNNNDNNNNDRLTAFDPGQPG